MTAARHLVVYLPGLGGSVLAQPDNLDDVVWDGGKRDIADLVTHPHRLSLAEAPHLEPVGVTQTTKLLGFTLVPGHEQLLEGLAKLGRLDVGDPRAPVADADVVVVPYDFRQSMVDIAEHLDYVVRTRLTDLSDAGKEGRVVVLAHSFGGLVARYWMSQNERWRWCRALVTLGTPHRGAPKALDWLVNGVRWKGARLVRPTLLRDWPSVVQTLPRYPAVRDTSATASKTALYPHELPMPWLTKQAHEAYALHLAVEHAWADMPRSGPEMVACIGWSHPTPDAAYWDGSSLTVTKDAPDWLGLEGREKDFGDGTVPSVSAQPPEFDNHVSSPIRLRERHLPMVSTDAVMHLLRRYLGIAPPDMVHGDERQAAMGLDLDDVHPAGEPIPLAAVLREVDADPDGLAVWASVRPTGDATGGTTAPAAVRLGWDAATASFQGELPGREPGMWAVEVIVREVPGAGDLRAADTAAVVEGG